MYRHLFREPTLISRFLMKEYQNYKCEEFGFRYASLAKLREEELDFNYLHGLEIYEHWEISRIALLPQIFTLLSSLHKVTRSESIMKFPQIEQINHMTALIDPNMFPIYDLSEQLHRNTAVSIWEHNQVDIYRKVKQKIGFWLEVKQSSIDHIEAGRGVFLRCEPGKSIPAGTLLGFVPGSVFDSYKDFEEVHPNSPSDQHFFRFDGAIINFNQPMYYPPMNGYTLSDYQKRRADAAELAKQTKFTYREPDNGGFTEVKAHEINPYAVGHFVNHTPREKSTNCSLIDLFIPKNFFQYELMKFWVNIYADSTKDYLNIKQNEHWLIKNYPKKQYHRGLGIIAVQDMVDGQELYLDYLESCLFDMQIEPPNWLIQPPPMHPQITKSGYQTKTNFVINLLEEYAYSMTKDGQAHDKFTQKVMREKQYI